ncbi:putative NAD(P)H quinone oxidoreductase, PIG3 family [Cohaesibacter sp. ES.047]|uniref:NAD(P)H-quinone oxidoreductase n=1 Tax=Cohaesibacter sp. ES.047 TaxID=1798205 RepID=UPI000BB79747|nr:NAD(P)H-quinone oxidoreductase [Cohaesibacter sp. ES.047]SNY90952.1 putative NAD(P)H quinone oxidoreductase, PIG3 family [Cohaesibacter sp. ES.047]
MSNPNTMKAVLAPEPGGPEALQFVDRPVPVPSEHEVLIKVEAAGVNRPDCIQRAGDYPPPPGASDILGLEVAGEIVAVGSAVSGAKPGDKTTALVSGGGYAEYCLAHEGSLLPVPQGWSMVEAASLPETFITVWHNVFQRGALQPGERLLIHGGSSGIGITAIQLAKLFGASVAVTAGSEEKCKACLDAGADLAINYREQEFVTELKTWTNRKGVNVILDMVGGDYISKNYVVAAEDARIVQIAFLKGGIAEADFRRLMMKRLIHTGSTLRARSDEIKAGIVTELKQKVWPKLAKNEVKPYIFKTFPFDEVVKAHALMESSNHIGKIMLTLD